MSNIGQTLHDLLILFILVQLRCNYHPNVALNHERFVKFDGTFSLRQDQYILYKLEVDAELQNIDKRFKIDRQIKTIKKSLKLDSNDSYIIHIPGKYMMKMIKLFIERAFGLSSRDIDSFNYRVAEKCNFHSLENLKNKINSYLN